MPSLAPLCALERLDSAFNVWKWRLLFDVFFNTLVLAVLRGWCAIAAEVLGDQIPTDEAVGHLEPPFSSEEFTKADGRPATPVLLPTR
jgi:hypothetical protein